MRNDRSLRVALIGCGEISKTHAGALERIEGVDVCAVVDTDRGRAARAADRRPATAVYTDAADMLTAESPDAVHILTPPQTHADLAVLAATAGCHVLVEKPFALSTKEARRIVSTAAENGVVVSACHNMVFKPSVEAARRLVATDAIGEVVAVSSFWGAIGVGPYAGQAGGHWAWRLPGGVFTNFLPHLISLQQAFMGGTLTVKGAALRADPAEEVRRTELLVTVEAPGSVGSMTLSLRAQPKMSFVDVYGTEGMVHVDLVREVAVVVPHRIAPGPLAKLAYSWDVTRQLAFGSVRSAVNVVSGRWAGNPGLPRLLEEFYRGLREGSAPPVSPEEALGATAAMESIWQAEPRLLEPIISDSAPSPRRTAPGPAVLAPTARALKRAFVTGATGYLGGHLASSLHAHGTEVVALVRQPNRVPFALEQQASIVCGDLSHIEPLVEAMTGCEVVFHCAAMTGNQASMVAAMEANAAGTERVCEAAAKAGVRRVVHVSSVAVYGVDHPRGAVLDERAALRPGGEFAPYQASKVAAEQRARQRADELGVELVIIRPGVLYGPGRAIRTGLVSLGRYRVGIGSGRNHMPFTYVGNVVDALLLAATTPAAAGEAFNIVDDPGVRVCDALHLVEPGARLVPVPVIVASAAARWAESRCRRSGREAPKLSRFSVQSASRDAVYDCSKATEILGWAPRVSLAEGIERSRPAR